MGMTEVASCEAEAVTTVCRPAGSLYAPPVAQQQKAESAQGTATATGRPHRADFSIWVPGLPPLPALRTKHLPMVGELAEASIGRATVGQGESYARAARSAALGSSPLVRRT